MVQVRKDWLLVLIGNFPVCACSLSCLLSRECKVSLSGFPSASHWTPCCLWPLKCDSLVWIGLEIFRLHLLKMRLGPNWRQIHRIFRKVTLPWFDVILREWEGHRRHALLLGGWRLSLLMWHSVYLLPQLKQSDIGIKLASPAQVLFLRVLVLHRLDVLVGVGLLEWLQLTARHVLMVKLLMVIGLELDWRMLLVSWWSALDQISRAHHASIGQWRARQEVEPRRPNVRLSQPILRVTILYCASRLKVLHSVVLFLLLLGSSYISIRWLNYGSLWCSISLRPRQLLALLIRIWTIHLLWCLLLICIEQEWLQVYFRFVREFAFQVVCLSQGACIDRMVGSLRSVVHLLLVLEEDELGIAIVVVMQADWLRAQTFRVHVVVQVDHAT